ncbi:hypothetical protein QTO34_009559 [Cnephaeus nilssonii]|uniref:Keratin, type II cytoskeletal 8 n=1 Tax=Cnephaeus nilssonii TaxID=3371016 RepID=A0AA40HIS4_CNENI|nr:hypothetical protein QTO34_009559 [Eptesicus nilssonii]
MANMSESYINKFQRQLDTLAQDKLRLEAEFGNLKGLVKDLKNKSKDEISKRTEMENEFKKKDVDEAYMSKAELEALLEGLADQIHFSRQLYEEMRELQSKPPTHPWCCPWTTTAPWSGSIIAEVKAQYMEIPNCSWAEAETRPCTRSSMRSCRRWLGTWDDLHRTNPEISEKNRTSANSRLRSRASKARGLPWRPCHCW